MASILELAKQHQESCGRGMRAARQAAFGSPEPAAWPIKSKALGCLPAEIPKIKKLLRSKGVDAEFTAKGECILKSQKHHKAVTAARGMFDYSGGYDSAGPTQMHKDLRQAQIKTIVENRMRFQRRVMQALMARGPRR